MGRSQFQIQRNKNKTTHKRIHLPFFINATRLHQSESIFKQNYNPLELQGFSCEYSEDYHKAERSTSKSQHTKILVEDTQNQSQLPRSSGLSKRISTHSIKIHPDSEDCVREPKVLANKNRNGECLPEFVEQAASPKRRLFGLEHLLISLQNIYRSILQTFSRDTAVKNVDEEMGQAVFPPDSRQTLLRTNKSAGNKLEVKNQVKEDEEMVEMSEDAFSNLLLFQRVARQQRLRRVSSDESDTLANSNDNHINIAGPPMLDFNEPLPDIPESDEVRPNPNNGDVGIGRDLDALTHAVSITSRENLQSVVSQLGLETPLQSKSSCHLPNHLHSLQQLTCCRHDVHNISIESLDLDVSFGFGNCTSRLYGKLHSKQSCSSIHY